MRVRVYISEVGDRPDRAPTLVLRDDTVAAIPLRLQDREWRFIAVMELGDSRLPAMAEANLAALKRDGYVVLDAEGPAPD